MERKWKILFLASFAELITEGLWFSFAPFTGSIGTEFSLSIAEIGLLASSAIWLVPFGRVISGFLADKYGATKMYTILLLAVGFFSIASAFAESYTLFFILRLFVAIGGFTLAVGEQHISQWFTEKNIGLAEGVFAATGTLGAAATVLFLPRIFGSWNGPLFNSGFRAAFFYIGILSAIYGIIYFFTTQDAPTKEIARKTAEKASLKEEIFMITRYGIIALSFAYVLSYGLEAALTGWLPTYFREGFGSNAVMAGTLAAVLPFVIAYSRPFSGYVSDWLEKNEINMLPIFRGRYREQWILFCMSYVVIMLVNLALAGRSGNLVLTIIALSQVALASGFASGAIFAFVPEKFPDRSGAAIGIISGVGSAGGIAFPLILASASQQGYIHEGYALLAIILIPIIMLNVVVLGRKTDYLNIDEGFIFSKDDHRQN